LDVSLKETHICVVDAQGVVLARGREVTHPELLAKTIRSLAPVARAARQIRIVSPQFLTQPDTPHHLSMVLSNRGSVRQAPSDRHRRVQGCLRGLLGLVVAACRMMA
jgi:hypothetical protein